MGQCSDITPETHNSSLTSRRSACRVFQRCTMHHCMYLLRWYQWRNASASGDTLTILSNAQPSSRVSSMRRITHPEERVSCGRNVADRNPFPDIYPVIPGDSSLSSCHWYAEFIARIRGCENAEDTRGLVYKMIIMVRSLRIWLAKSMEILGPGRS